MKRNLLLFTCCFLFIGSSLFAQESSSTTTTSTTSTSKYGLPSPKDFDRWSIGLSFGNTFFFGDVIEDEEKNNNAFKSLPFAPAAGLQVTYQASHSVGLRLSGTWGNFIAGPSDEKLYNVKGIDKTFDTELESTVFEGAFEGVYTFGNISHLKRNKKFHFYITMGVGFFNFNGDLTGKRVEDSTAFVVETGSVTEPMIPASLGIKYQIKRFDIGASWNYRVTFTDKVDAVNNPVTEYDNYGFFNLNLNYTLGKKNKPMEWINPMEVVYNDIADLKDKVDILSGDKDKDGVSDMFDKDNSTAEGIKVYGDGTSVDTDGDGVIDSKDGDPYSLKNAKVDANGVEIDTDVDGVADSRDLEPNTEKGKMVNFQGMTIKTGDNLMGVVEFLPSIYFDINSSEIKQVYKDRIMIVARAMKANPELNVMITGNTDMTAGDDFNDKLGLKRADAVKNHLVKVYGIDAARLSTQSKGEKDPMANTPNKTLNRRADFSVVKK